jgi:hypothetical protein
VLRTRETRRSSSASENEVGGFQARCASGSKKEPRASAIARRRAEDERDEGFFLGERGRSRRIPSAMRERLQKGASSTGNETLFGLAQQLPHLLQRRIGIRQDQIGILE